MKNKRNLIPACIAALACSVPIATSAATKKSPAPAPSPSASASPKVTATPKPTTSPAAHTTVDAAKARALPFHGMISAVDQKAKTFTIEEARGMVARGEIVDLKTAFGLTLV